MPRKSGSPAPVSNMQVQLVGQQVQDLRTLSAQIESDLRRTLEEMHKDIIRVIHSKTSTEDDLFELSGRFFGLADQAVDVARSIRLVASEVVYRNTHPERFDEEIEAEEQRESRLSANDTLIADLVQHDRASESELATRLREAEQASGGLQSTVRITPQVHARMAWLERVEQANRGPVRAAAEVYVLRANMMKLDAHIPASLIMQVEEREAVLVEHSKK